MLYTLDGICYNIDAHNEPEWVKSERYDYCENFRSVKSERTLSWKRISQKLHKFASFFL